MPRIDLSPEELQLLAQVVDVHLSELRMEIGNTDDVDFREGLKRREEMLRKIRSRLGGISGNTRQA